jgi:dephospho-CoA kinase
MVSHSPFPRPQTDAIFVGFAGHIGAGKTSAATYLNAKYGFQYTRYSQVLWDWVGSAAEGPVGLQELGWEIMAGGRQGELNARLIAGLQRMQSAAIDGLRHAVDFDSLSRAFGASFRLVFLDAAPQIRFQRRRERFTTFQAFLEADSRPVEGQIDNLKRLATAAIPNEESIEKLFDRIDGWLAVCWKGVVR